MKLNRYKKISFIFVSFALFFLFSQCKNSYGNKDSGFIDFNNSRIEKDKWYEISVIHSPGSDSLIGIKEVWLDIRYNDKFPYKSLPLNIEESSLSLDTTFLKKVDIVLFDDENKNFKGVKPVYETSLKINEAQDWGKDFKLAFSSPLDSIEGIVSIGFMLKP